MITHASYAIVIFGVQVLFVLAWTVASRPPAPRIVAGVGMAAAGVADLAAVLVDEASLAPLAYVTAAAVIVGVIGQLTRPPGAYGSPSPSARRWPSWSASWRSRR
jgi:hypothetical protein